MFGTKPDINRGRFEWPTYLFDCLCMSVIYKATFWTAMLSCKVYVSAALLLLLVAVSESRIPTFAQIYNRVHRRYQDYLLRFKDYYRLHGTPCKINVVFNVSGEFKNFFCNLTFLKSWLRWKGNLLHFLKLTLVLRIICFFLFVSDQCSGKCSPYARCTYEGDDGWNCKCRAGYTGNGAVCRRKLLL